MKKIFALLLVVFGMFFVFGCKKPKTPEPEPTPTVEPKPSTEPVVTPTPVNPTTPVATPTDLFEKSEGVMTYAEYAAAELDSPVVIEAFIQATQTFNPAYGNITLYLADNEGAYFVYRMVADQDLVDKCTTGAKVRVTGTKSEWSGEVEITNATIEFLDGSYVFEAKDCDILGADLIESQNQYVYINDLVVLDKGDGAAFLYKHNGSGSHEENSDLYYDVCYGGKLFTFVVESDLCDNTTAVYAAVEELEVGDVINVEGFLYWYEDAQLHTTKVTKTGNINTKSEGVMTYEEFQAAELDSNVVIEAYIQDGQVFNPAYNNLTLYLADASGAYFVYRAPATQEDADKCLSGAKVRVTGRKAEWSGEVEIADATLEFLEGDGFIAPAKDVTKEEEWGKFANQLVMIKGLVVADKGDGAAFLYRDNGSGSHEENSDLYYDVVLGENKYTFVVESDLRGNMTEVYAAVENLKVGDVITVIGYMYWYENPQVHTIQIIVEK